MYTKQAFPNGVYWWGEQFEQNGQKLHENYKIKGADKPICIQWLQN